MARRQTFQVDVEGFPELLRKLRVLPDSLQGRVLKEATMEGGEVLREFQEALAPRGQEGAPHAAEFIAAVLDEGASQQPTRAQVDVGPTGPGFYLTFHETGTLYMPSQPFMRPAAEAAEGEVFRTVAEVLRRNLVRTAARRSL